MAFNDSQKMKSKENPDLNNSWTETSATEQDEEEVDEEELDSINNELDQLNNALDQLEQKNDNIHAQLMQLLESNRQARKQFQQLQSPTVSPDTEEEKK